MSRIRQLGWIHAVFGGLGVAAAALVCLWLGMVEGGKPLLFFAPLVLMFTGSYFAPALVGGIGLLRGAEWGRWTIGILSFWILLLFPIGTALGGFGIWVLLGSGRHIPAEAPSQTPSLPTAPRLPTASR